MQGNTGLAALILDYSLYLWQWIDVTDQKESSLPNPVVEPLPRTKSSYGGGMG